jgi:hypothetical protein
MPTTANYSWPTPADTDLVKDGAEAIRDLGDAIDTTTKAVADAQGLVHIKTVDSGGAVSSFSVNDCFSAQYNTYRIIFNLAASSAGADVNLRLRVSATDESGSIYRRQALTANNTSITGIRLTNETSWVGVQFIFDTIANSGGANHLEIFNPFEAKPTSAETILAPAIDGAIQFIKQVFGINNSVSYTGFTIIPASGTVNGTVTVLGYKK